MKTLNLEQMEMVEGGRADVIEAACLAAGMGVGVQLVGVALNLWNPIGIGWGLFWAATTIGCGVYSLAK